MIRASNVLVAICDGVPDSCGDSHSPSMKYLTHPTITLETSKASVGTATLYTVVKSHGYHIHADLYFSDLVVLTTTPSIQGKILKMAGTVLEQIEIRSIYAGWLNTDVRILPINQQKQIGIDRNWATPPQTTLPPLQTAYANPNPLLVALTSLPTIPSKNTVIVNFVDQLDKCECGAFKASGATKGMVGHSSWCPWSVNKNGH